MKILYIITQAEGGGAQKYVLQLAKHFQGEIAAGVESDELFQEAAKLNIPIHRLKYLRRSIHPLWDFLGLIELYQLIKKIRPDIVNLNSSKAGFLGSFAGKLTGAKVIFTAHGFRFHEPGSSLQRQIFIDLERLASLCRDYIIAVSQADFLSAINHKIIAENKISVIHNGITEISFLDRSSARQKLNLPENRFIFGTIAGFYKTKGLDVLIEAVNLLRPDIRESLLFVLIGDGIEFENLKFKILNLKLNNLIKQPGRMAQAWEYLKAFDAFILPSRKEGFPYTLLEAMKAGLPIIATDAFGNKEAVGDAALLIPPENSKALATAIEKLFSHNQTRITLAHKSLQRSEQFTEQKMFDQTSKVYDKVME